MKQRGANRVYRREWIVCQLAGTQAEVSNPVNPVIVSSTQVSSFEFQVSFFTATYITKDNALWQEATQSVHPDFDSDRAVTTAKSRRKLTNLGTFVSVSESEDIRGNVTTSTQTVDPGTGHTFSSTTVPTSTQPQVQIQRYGLLVESVSATAVTNRYAYDGLNRRVAVTDGRDNTTTTAYNGLGQVAYTEDATTNRTTYVYDQFGRQVETIDALNQSTHTVYDLRGNVVKQYGATYPVWYEYDAEGRMVAMATTRDATLDPATVDSFDHPSLDVTRWNYDPATGLLVQKLYDDGEGPSYTYTPDGKLATRTWARGVVTEYGYDALGSLLSVNYSDATPDVAYTYDRLGHQLSAIAAGVSTNLYVYSINTLELIAETQNGVVVNRSRDAFGRESGIALESDYDVDYGYDAYGRFHSVSSSVDSVSSVVNYSYLPGSSLVSGMTTSSGHAWSRSYELNRNLITSVTNSFNGNLISAFDYVNDALGRRTARLDSQPAGVAITNAFGYNVRSEVTSANMGTNAYGYVFDPIGNRIVSTNNAELTSYAVNELNQYTNILCASAPPREPTHDDDGNMTFLPSTAGGGAGGEGWSFQWNGENRLILASNENALVTYAYDHRGRMTWKTVCSENASSTKTIQYVWDDFNIIAETIAADSATNTTYNVWGLDLDGTLQGAGGVGGLLSVISPRHLGEGQGEGSTVYLPCYDANGNIMEYVAADGAIAAHREYDPFGGTVVITGNTDGFTHWFSTKPWCPVTGLSEYQFRKYSPVLGRWLTRDPIREQGYGTLFDFNQAEWIRKLQSLISRVGQMESSAHFKLSSRLRLEFLRQQSSGRAAMNMAFDMRFNNDCQLYQFLVNDSVGNRDILGLTDDKKPGTKGDCDRKPKEPGECWRDPGDLACCMYTGLKRFCCMKTVGKVAENGAGKQAGCLTAKTGCENCCTKNYFVGNGKAYVECMANCESKFIVCSQM